MERLATEIGATHVGAEMDPSHLFWQGIDPTEAVRSMGELVYNAAAKDTRINPLSKVNGNLDDAFSWVREGEAGFLGLGGPHTLSGWPTPSSWDLGRGHDVDWWAGFLEALREIDEDMAVNIEHEDRELDQMEGLRYAAGTLLEAAKLGGAAPAEVSRLSDAIGVAVIGAGMAGRSHAHGYRTAQTVFGTDAPPVRLVAIASRRHAARPGPRNAAAGRRCRLSTSPARS
jgi:hypothetical protein